MRRNTTPNNLTTTEGTRAASASHQPTSGPSSVVEPLGETEMKGIAPEVVAQLNRERDAEVYVQKRYTTRSSGKRRREFQIYDDSDEGYFGAVIVRTENEAIMIQEALVAKRLDAQEIAMNKCSSCDAPEIEYAIETTKGFDIQPTQNGMDCHSCRHFNCEICGSEYGVEDFHNHPDNTDIVICPFCHSNLSTD